MTDVTARRFSISVAADSANSAPVSSLLSERTGLSKAKVKDAMNKGAVWIRKKRGGLKRLRRATAKPSAGDVMELHYDERLLALVPPGARCVCDERFYSVWYKPAGLLSQGTKYSDHCSLMRQAELKFGRSREVYLVHRLDREASGLMLLAHTREAAARLSEIFRENRVEKRYRAEVTGLPATVGEKRTISLPLDGKSAVTEYIVESHDAALNRSVVTVWIRTGRLHQIRRHFDMLGCPVVGDPRYGRDNKNLEGLKLEALSLRFICPFRRCEVSYSS